jgi:hypothetical protein
MRLRYPSRGARAEALEYERDLRRRECLRARAPRVHALLDLAEDVLYGGKCLPRNAYDRVSWIAMQLAAIAESGRELSEDGARTTRSRLDTILQEVAA